MSKPWKRCKALVRLVTQINSAWPGRDTSADGSIGDADHASRSSDHNPWVIDPADGIGVVTAQDIDEDLNATTHSLKSVIDAICASRDERVKYIIYEGRITVKGSDLQQWKDYHGKNAHKHHAHISVKAEKKYWNDDSPWSIGSAAAAPAENPADSKTSNEAASKPAVTSTTDQAGPLMHTVAAGDTLWGLASRYQISVAGLRKLNGLTSDKIMIGQVLKVQ